MCLETQIALALPFLLPYSVLQDLDGLTNDQLGQPAGDSALGYDGRVVLADGVVVVAEVRGLVAELVSELRALDAPHLDPLAVRVSLDTDADVLAVVERVHAEVGLVLAGEVVEV